MLVCKRCVLETPSDGNRAKSQAEPRGRLAPRLGLELVEM